VALKPFFLKIQLKYLFFLVVFIVLSSCSHKDQNTDFVIYNGYAFGTTYKIKIRSTRLSKNIAEQATLEDNIVLELKRLDLLFSSWNKDSVISKFNASPINTWVEVPREVAYLLKKSITISKKTKGKFDITIGGVVDIWGFGSSKTNSIPSKKEVKKFLMKTGIDNLIVDEENSRVLKKLNLEINVSAIAKGYIVDKISSFLSKKNFIHHMVEIGGEIKVSGFKENKEKWKIYIKKPRKISSELSFLINVTNIGIATSGDYSNYIVVKGKKMSHIIDPVSGYPKISDISSVTVMHKDVAVADAFATAFMIMNVDSVLKIANENKLSVMIIFHKGDIFNAVANHAWLEYINKNNK
jgi:thiamine biosynthesis lipoprotein